jgi:hypothetical protein
MILDLYFRRPVLIDYILGLSASAALYLIWFNTCFDIPSGERLTAMTSDLSNIGLTSCGFILTLLTVLITFKSTVGINKKDYSNDNSLFQLFFVSDLYFITVRILKNCIKSLIVTSVFGYAFKLGLPKEDLHYLFYFNSFVLIIITLTLYRCLLILTKILNMQTSE